jgi:hypothetical protein
MQRLAECREVCSKWIKENMRLLPKLGLVSRQDKPNVVETTPQKPH